MGKIKQEFGRAIQYKEQSNKREKILRGEKLTHKRGDNLRTVMYIAPLDKGLCKVVNNEGKIEAVPEFELIRGRDDRRVSRQQREDQNRSTDHSREPGEPTRTRKGFRNAS